MKKALGIGKIIVRLVIIIGVVLSSGIMAVIVATLFQIGITDDKMSTLMRTLIYLCYMIDIKVNNICLLYQYGFSQKLFDKRCKLCSKCFRRIMFCKFKARLAQTIIDSV